MLGAVGIVPVAQFGTDLAKDGCRFGGQRCFGGRAGEVGRRTNREGSGLVCTPPGGQFQDGLSGLVDLPGLGVEVGALVFQEGGQGLGEGFGRSILAAEGAETLNADGPPVGLLGIESLVEEPLLVELGEVRWEGRGLGGGWGGRIDFGGGGR